MTEKSEKEIKPQVVESGIMTFGKEGVQYFYEIVYDCGKFRKYAFRPGECLELDPRTNEFINLVDSYSPSSMNEEDFSSKEEVNRTPKRK